LTSHCALKNLNVSSGLFLEHQQDVEATLSGKADDFAKLWDSEAVRIGPGGPAEIGKALIYADDKHEENSGGAVSLLQIRNQGLADCGGLGLFLIQGIGEC
jgi:hypothetical protein